VASARTYPNPSSRAGGGVPPRTAEGLGPVGGLPAGLPPTAPTRLPPPTPAPPILRGVSRQTPAKLLPQLETSLTVLASGDEEWKFYKLPDLARLAFEAGDLQRAHLYATEILNQAPKYQQRAGFYGALHMGNIMLGRIALRAGETRRAADYLLEAGRVAATYRPQPFGAGFGSGFGGSGILRLSSFGPNMSLAR